MKIILTSLSSNTVYNCYLIKSKLSNKNDDKSKTKLFRQQHKENQKKYYFHLTILFIYIL